MHRSAYWVVPMAALALVMALVALLGVDYPLVLPYAWHKALHIVGAVLFLGNIVVSAFWSVLALRTGNPGRVHAAMSAVNWSDALFTAPGVLLLMANGLPLATTLGGPFATVWTTWGLWLLLATLVVWIGAVVPDQHRLLGLAAAAEGGTWPTGTWRTVLRWNVVGGVAALLPWVALFLMVLKP